MGTIYLQSSAAQRPFSQQRTAYTMVVRIFGKSR